MPPLQIQLQRSEHLRHPLPISVVLLLEGPLDVDDPFLEVSDDEAVVGLGRGVCGDDLRELLGKHRVEVPCSAGYEGVYRRVLPQILVLQEGFVTIPDREEWFSAIDRFL